jgi:hypothetical protein
MAFARNVEILLIFFQVVLSLPKKACLYHWRYPHWHRHFKIDYNLDHLLLAPVLLQQETEENLRYLVYGET